MDATRTIRLRWLHGELGDIGYHVARFRFHRPVPTWQPAINAYRCHKCIRICVDLAGVDRSAIELRVESNRLTVRGTREVAEPAEGKKRHAVVQILMMEIDYGAFERIVELPDEIDVRKAHADQENGLLWIHLPLKT